MFGILKFGHCDLFGICDLLFEIFSLLKPETLGSLQHVVRQNPVRAYISYGGIDEQRFQSLVKRKPDPLVAGHRTAIVPWVFTGFGFF